MYSNVDMAPLLTMISGIDGLIVEKKKRPLALPCLAGLETHCTDELLEAVSGH